MDDMTLAKVEAQARDLLIKAFNDDNIDSETYIMIHDLHASIIKLGFIPTTKKFWQFWK